MGRTVHGKSRPIIAKFVQFKERKAAFTKLIGEQNRNYGINAQFPRENNEKRKKKCGTSWFLSQNLFHMFNKKPFLKNQILHTRISSNSLLSSCRTSTYMCTVCTSRHDLILHRAIGLLKLL